MKALKFLKHMKQTDTPYNFRECELDEAIIELEEAQLTRREWYQKGYAEAMKTKTCEWCKHSKATISSVICGKNGTYKEADDYCKYFMPKGNA